MSLRLSDVSCRQHIEHFTAGRTLHFANVLATRFALGHAYQSPVAEPIPDDIEPTPESLAHAQNVPEGSA